MDEKVKQQAKIHQKKQHIVQSLRKQNNIPDFVLDQDIFDQYRQQQPEAISQFMPELAEIEGQKQDVFSKIGEM